MNDKEPAKFPFLFLLLVVACVFIFSCQKEIHFEDQQGNQPPDADTTATLAEYTLINSPNDCMVDSLAGFFVKGSAIDSSLCKIFIQVNVTKAGVYQISTGEINGYSFIGSGTFGNTGNQVIVLNAQGTPSAAEENVFALNTGSSSCSFVIDVLDVVAVSSDDYFPLTPGSWWSYEDLTPRGDTMMRKITDTNNVNGVVYTIMSEQKKGPERSYLFRESPGGEYFEYAAVDKYASSLSYTPAVFDEIYFLNDVLFNNATWESTEYTGTIIGGQPILLKYDFACIQENATIVLNGKAFVNVYVLNMRPQIRAVDYAYNTTGEDYYFYYAKGIGIIYMSKYDLGRLQSEWRIKDWEVK